MTETNTEAKEDKKEEHDPPYKSYYKYCKAWSHYAMRRLTKKWIILNPRTNLFLNPSPLANIIAQTHNMIRVYGAHTMTEIENWNLAYDELGKMFDRRLAKPKWYKKKYPGIKFSPRDYLIRGHPEKKASNPSFVCRVINSVLSKCSHLKLRREHETASWVRILRSDADDGNYVVFFKVQPFEGEEMYDNRRMNGGEYLQMALVDVARRVIVPGNSSGTGLVIGREIEILCDDGKRSTQITDVINRPTTTSKVKGLYPSEFFTYEKRRVTMQGIYEIMDTRRTTLKGEGVYTSMEEFVRERQKRKRDQGTEDAGNNDVDEKDFEVKDMFKTGFGCESSDKTEN